MRQKLIDIFNLIFGFRKFLAWLALFLVAIFFRIFNLVDGEQFVDLLKTTFMGFVAANGFEHIMSATKEYIKGKVASAPDSVTLEDK
ncbi:hypothetical protein CCP1ISM_130019 [Azospirillaceae bacterium]